MIQPVILWTDALVYLLVVVVVLFAFYARGREHLRAPWREVVRSRIAVASLVVLLFYTATGLLDSLHFRKVLPQQDGQQQVQYSGEVLSLLDELLGPMRTQEEKTYSAPFATHLYTKEAIIDADGRQTRDYPRLRYGGAHLADPASEKGADIRQRSLRALGQAGAVLLLLTAILALLLARRWRCSPLVALRRVLAGGSVVPWRTALAFVGLFLLLIALIANLSAWYHMLGTDKVGQDVLYQSIKSIRTGLVIGTLTTLVMLPFAVFLGMMAGYFRGWVDDVIQYLYTTLNSIPGVLLIAAAVLMMQVYMSNHPEMFETMAERADLRLLFLCLILGITSWTGLCRLLRGETLKLRELDYVQAADAFGVGRFTIMVRHLLPNLLHLVLIAVVLDFSGLVLAEAVLSYVGVGVDPTTMSWGNMINRARLEMAREPMVWWSLLAAFAFMFTLVLAANLFSDAVRDAFDPRLRAQR
ncbi:MAG TPA: ABC transporter permease [Gammaproteobacteria bacterium]|nr:ABC transporter permease [Gammaproteobacteria bacterium]